MFVKSRDGTAPSRVSTVTATVVVVLIRCFITVEAPAQGMVLGSAAQGFLPTSIQETQFTCIPWGEPKDFYTNQRHSWEALRTAVDELSQNRLQLEAHDAAGPPIHPHPETTTHGV